MKRTLVGMALFLGLGLAFAGCKKPDCKKAVDHTFKILSQEANSLTGAAKDEALKKIASHKATALADCKAGKPDKLSKSKYSCIMKSKSKADLDKCEK